VVNVAIRANVEISSHEERNSNNGQTLKKSGQLVEELFGDWL